jgi:hypothetical protein
LEVLGTAADQVNDFPSNREGEGNREYLLTGRLIDFPDDLRTY